MGDSDYTIQIIILTISALSLFIACCTPCMTALTNVIMFGGFRIMRDRLSPPTPASNNINMDSKLVCQFQNDSPI